jgi:hypothetical protein
VLWTFIALLGYFAVESAVFRSGWYSNYLEPNSTTGEVEYHLLWLRQAARAKVPEVLVVGDSRIAEGFSSRTAEAAIKGAVHFTNFGLPGSSPRVWYYVLRDADPGRDRFSKIVIALDHYSDEDWGEDLRNRRSDMNYLAGRLRLTDCYSFAKSFADQKMRRSVLTECLLRGTSYRPDFLAFLKDIPDRLARAKDWREKGAGYIDGYGGKPEDLVGLLVDREKHTVQFPAGAKDWQTTTAQHTIFPEAFPQTGALTKYRTQWLGRILDLYKGSSTKIVFIQIPRAPWPTPNSPVPARFIDSVKTNPNLVVIPPETFTDLERPEVFSDGLHLNHAGRPIFSELLARKLAEVK